MSLAHRSPAVLLLTLSALFCGVLTAPPAAAADTDPPRITSVTFSPSSVRVSGLDTVPVTVTVHLTDETGVYGGTAGASTYPELQVSPVSGKPFPFPTHLTLTSGTVRDGDWSVPLTVPSTWNGDWQVTVLGAYDTEFNLLAVDPRTQGFTSTLRVAGTHIPALSFGFSPNPVLGNGAFDMKGRAYFTDTGAPISGHGLSTGVDNICVESVPVNDIVTNADGYYGRRFTNALLGLYCVRLLTPAPPGRDPGFAVIRNGSPTVQYLVSAAAERTPIPLGTSVAINGNVLPNAAGKSVRLERLTAGQWRQVNTGPVRASGRYTVLATPPTAGNHRYRVHLPGGPGVATFLPGFSPTVLVGAVG
jgi:hypothetical protein